MLSNTTGQGKASAGPVPLARTAIANRETEYLSVRGQLDAQDKVLEELQNRLSGLADQLSPILARPPSLSADSSPEATQDSKPLSHTTCAIRNSNERVARCIAYIEDIQQALNLS
jgi:hypothetical protein